MATSSCFTKEGKKRKRKKNKGETIDTFCGLVYK